MLCYSDPDYWLGALLLAFESHQKGPLGRAAGLPVVLGFPETDNRITDLQVNVPPAAMVAFLAGRTHQLPTCPATKYVVDPQGLPQVHGQISQEALQAWAEAAKHTNLETARLAQQPGVTAFVRISLQGSQTLGHRQYQEFRPGIPPVHFLDAIRQALAASVANQGIERFWSVYNLEWPDTTARVVVFLRRVLLLESLLVTPAILEPSVATTQAPSEVCCISSDTEEASPAAFAETPEAADELEAQVHDWRFSELRTTDLAALREVDVCTPFRLPALEDEHWQGLSTTPNRHGPQRARPAWYDAATAHWAALKGLTRSKHPTKQRLNSFWYKLYCHGNPKEPEPSALATALSTFPFQTRDEGAVHYWQVQEATRAMWHSAKANMARRVGVPIPTGIPAWGVDEEELSQACLLSRNTAVTDPSTAAEGVSVADQKSGKRADTPSSWYRSRHPDWEGPWQ